MKENYGSAKTVNCVYFCSHTIASMKETEIAFVVLLASVKSMSSPNLH